MAPQTLALYARRTDHLDHIPAKMRYALIPVEKLGPISEPICFRPISSERKLNDNSHGAGDLEKHWILNPQSAVASENTSNFDSVGSYHFGSSPMPYNLRNHTEIGIWGTKKVIRHGWLENRPFMFIMFPWTHPLEEMFQPCLMTEGYIMIPFDTSGSCRDAVHSWCRTANNSPWVLRNVGVTEPKVAAIVSVGGVDL